ncbi:MAG: penicillin acylase family protein [Oscillochloridaceae bacterium umkhey_bin13]
MFEFARLTRTIGLSLGLAAGAAGLGAVAALRRPLPRTAGKLSLNGLEAQATVRRDRWGIPHLRAASNDDLFAALGFVHAQDRLWQMELNRRTGHGQLAELFGPLALSSDQFMRTLGFTRLARRELDHLDDETRAPLAAYVRGVNAFLEQSRRQLPIEYNLLGIQPRPWELIDLLVWPKVMSLSLAANWMGELFAARLAELVGPERAAALDADYPANARVTMPTQLGEAALRMASEAARFNGVSSAPQGSNAWVVAGSRSANGRPLLADDPHLGLAIPAIWYVAHLEGGDYHVAGATFPGFPGVVIGHNRQIAWGVTNAMTDTQDLYIEQIHPNDPDLYRWQDGWRQIETIREEIVVKGQKAVTLHDVRLTHHGPIIDEVSGPAASPLRHLSDPATPLALALRWTTLEPRPHTARSIFRINRAHDWASFRAALHDWDVAPQNFVYADQHGNIGYTLAGLHPVRVAGHDGRTPVPGWDGAYEWLGCIPTDELPTQFNPAEGMIVTANHRLVGSDHPLAEQLPGEYANPYRAERIAALLAATPTHDARSFAHIHNDVRSLPGLALARLVTELTPTEPLEQAARDLLVAWDGNLTADSAAGAVYASLRYQLLRLAYHEIEPLGLAQAGLGAFAAIPANRFLEHTLPELIARIEVAPLPQRPDPWLGHGQTWHAILSEALRRASTELHEQLGPNPAHWSYGKVHSLTLRHALGSAPALAPLFNRGPWPMGGDLDTVNQQYVPRHTAAGPRYNAPSYRQIFDPGDWDSARISIPTGQSGHPASQHYADMAAIWRAGGYVPLLWSDEAIARHTVATLILEPRS